MIAAESKAWGAGTYVGVADAYARDREFAARRHKRIRELTADGHTATAIVAILRLATCDDEGGGMDQLIDTSLTDAQKAAAFSAAIAALALPQEPRKPRDRALTMQLWMAFNADPDEALTARSLAQDLENHLWQVGISLFRARPVQIVDASGYPIRTAQWALRLLGCDAPRWSNATGASDVATLVDFPETLWPEEEI